MTPDTFKAIIAEIEREFTDAYFLRIILRSGQRVIGAWSRIDGTDEAICVTTRHNRNVMVPLASIIVLAGMEP